MRRVHLALLLLLSLHSVTSGQEKEPDDVWAAPRNLVQRI
jgi:hypothetical protein